MDELEGTRQGWRTYVTARWPLFVIFFAVAGLLALSLAFAHEIFRSRTRAVDATYAPSVIWRPPPSFVKGIYVSAATVGAKKRFAELVDLVDRTELNTMVIDVKSDKGDIAFASKNDAIASYIQTKPLLGNLRELTAPLRKKNIYLIARLFVFEDPAYATHHPEHAVQQKTGGMWHDRKGLAWVDPASRADWAYNVAIAKEAYAGGFDEIQFDYVRFPTDGAISSMAFPHWDGKISKAQVIGDFFSYLDSELRGTTGMMTSVDLFGLTMWQHSYDMNIGQRLALAVPHFDFISPMVYPSHYPRGFDGFDNPADHPYDIVYKNLVKGRPVIDQLRSASPDARLASFRPWIQDFDFGAVYTPEMVRAQMQASVDGGATGWILWNARNVYTESAFLTEDVEKKITR